jgi:hypothetical protein
VGPRPAETRPSDQSGAHAVKCQGPPLERRCGHQPTSVGGRMAACDGCRMPAATTTSRSASLKARSTSQASSSKRDAVHLILAHRRANAARPATELLRTSPHGRAHDDGFRAPAPTRHALRSEPDGRLPPEGRASMRSGVRTSGPRSAVAGVVPVSRGRGLAGMDVRASGSVWYEKVWSWSGSHRPSGSRQQCSRPSWSRARRG